MTWETVCVWHGSNWINDVIEHKQRKRVVWEDVTICLKAAARQQQMCVVCAAHTVETS